ncbi:YkvA family protein [Candidatus Uabimicrobium amorphum]|uniref:DUF1232 domain-containing protein n=1 Tax=Uabimicrobium amorphum TaxID=2596890 RepID=A0A5S9IK56_UABAM|nr:YkvA family protein [Candidatus Uabimicrobium amorphum]BBM83353.1 hypothetical protein UABAM_01705 [Candidatus Uabimicrobium amorphum]
MSEQKYRSENEKYREQYSDKNFWDKLKSFAKIAGYELVEKALVLYYCFQDENTPQKAKLIILGALGYFISPIDIIPDFLPLIGFTDDLGMLIWAMGTIATNIREKHRIQAQDKARAWFN